MPECQRPSKLRHASPSHLPGNPQCCRIQHCHGQPSGLQSPACLQLLDDPDAAKVFPKDAVGRARKYLDAIGSTGAYTESQGAIVFREEIAEVQLGLASSTVR